MTQDSVFVKRVAYLLRNRRLKAVSSSTNQVPPVTSSSSHSTATIASSSSKSEQQRTLSTSPIQQLSKDSTDSTVLISINRVEVPDPYSILMTCIDYVLHIKRYCSRKTKLNPEHDKWPFPSKYNSTFVEYTFRTKITFQLLLFQDEIGCYVFVQNSEKPDEYKVICCNDIQIPTFEIFDSTGSEKPDKLTEEIQKLDTVINFVDGEILTSFVTESEERSNHEFYGRAVFSVFYQKSEKTKKPKIDDRKHLENQEELTAEELIPDESRVYEKLMDILKAMPLESYPTSTALMMGIFVELMSEDIRCSIEKRDPWPVDVKYDGEAITCKIMDICYAITIKEIEIGFIVNLRNVNYNIHLTGRLLSKDLVPTFDEEDEDLDLDRFAILAFYVSNMIEFLKEKSIHASSSTPVIHSPAQVDIHSLENNSLIVANHTVQEIDMDKKDTTHLLPTLENNREDFTIICKEFNDENIAESARILQGKLEAKLEIAKKLFEQNIDLETISKWTQLPKNQIEEALRDA